MPTPARRAAMHERIVRLYTTKNLSSYAIGERVGLSTASVARIIKARGLTKPHGSFAKPDATKQSRNERIIRLYTEENLTTSQVADRIGGGYTPSAVAYILRSRGVPRRRTGEWSPPRPAAYHRTREYAKSIAPLIGTGPGTAAIDFARARGIKPTTLRVHLRALGVKMHYGLGSARLLLKDATAIKRVLVKGGRTFQEIADTYNVSPNTVWGIAMGRSWLNAPWPGGKVYQPRSARAGTVRTDSSEPREPGQRKAKPRATGIARKTRGALIGSAGRAAR